MTTNSAAPQSVESRVAAKWWADQLREGFLQSNRADDHASRLAGVLLTTKQRTRTLSEETVAAFESALARRIDEELSTGPDAQKAIATDYSPGPTLLEAASEAGMGLKPGDMSTFPMKTYMRIRHGEVLLKSGSWKTLWSATPAAPQSEIAIYSEELRGCGH